MAYRIVKDGFSGALMYAPGEVAADSSAGSLFGANFGYKNDVFAVGIGYNSKNNELGDKSLTSTVLGASMNFGGNSKVSSLVANFKDDHPDGLSTISDVLSPVHSCGGPGVGAGDCLAVENAFIEGFKQDGVLYHIGYRYFTGPHTVSVAYNQLNDSRPANADVASYGVGLYLRAVQAHRPECGGGAV